jgi:hypothetical protein
MLATQDRPSIFKIYILRLNHKIIWYVLSKLETVFKINMEISSCLIMSIVYQIIKICSFLKNNLAFNKVFCQIRI